MPGPDGAGPGWFRRLVRLPPPGLALVVISMAAASVLALVITVVAIRVRRQDLPDGPVVM
jgi:hypothetical protein